MVVLSPLSLNGLKLFRVKAKSIEDWVTKEIRKSTKRCTDKSYTGMNAILYKILTWNPNFIRILRKTTINMKAANTQSNGNAVR